MDKQKGRLYAFEDYWGWNCKAATQDECRTIITWACDSYDVPVPTIRFRKWRTWYDPDDHSIVLGNGNQNAAIALHEAAHAIHYWLVGEAHEDHGPEWLAIYMWLLRSAKIAPEAPMKDTAAKFKLRWRELDRHSPRRVRATYASLCRSVDAARECP